MTSRLNRFELEEQIRITKELIIAHWTVCLELDKKKCNRHKKLTIYLACCIYFLRKQKEILARA